MAKKKSPEAPEAGDATPGGWIDLGTYRRMLAPHASIEAASAAWEGFIAELRPIREKFGIPDITLVAVVNYSADGREQMVLYSGHIGNPSIAIDMLAAVLKSKRAAYIEDLKATAEAETRDLERREGG